MFDLGSIPAIVKKANEDYQAWRSQFESPPEWRTPWDFLPEEIKDQYYWYIDEGNDRNDLVTSLCRYHAEDADGFGHELLAMYENLNEAENEE